MNRVGAGAHCRSRSPQRLGRGGGGDQDHRLVTSLRTMASSGSRASPAGLRVTSVESLLSGSVSGCSATATGTKVRAGPGPGDPALRQRDLSNGNRSRARASRGLEPEEPRRLAGGLSQASTRLTKMSISPDLSVSLVRWSGFVVRWWARAGRGGRAGCWACGGASGRSRCVCVGWPGRVCVAAPGWPRGGELR